MARKKSDGWGCEHPLPIGVVPLGDGRRARCLRCGPVRPDAEGALRALRGPTGRQEKIGA